MDSIINQELAILGGAPAVPTNDLCTDLFKWPIVTDEDEAAVLKVLREGRMSGIGQETREFEKQYAAWSGAKYGLAHCNGTMSLLVAMWAAGVSRGTEVICPNTTYWASATQALSLGASVVFADIDRHTLCIDPQEIEKHITPATRAVVVVHYCGYPCDMDAILAIAKRHDIRVIEDVSHAQGTLYKGKMVGTFGDVAGLSMMTGKSFPIGEGGMLLTSDREIYERALAFGHYERHNEITDPVLMSTLGVPLGGFKARINQACSAMGLVQLKYYPQRIAEIQKSLNYFWDLLEGTPGLYPHRPDPKSGSTMGGWYHPMGLYDPDELGGLPAEMYCRAVEAENGMPGRPANAPLNRFAIFHTADVYGEGHPTNRPKHPVPTEADESEVLGVSTQIHNLSIGIPHFKSYQPEKIECYAAAYKKVALQAEKLLTTCVAS